MRTEKAFCKEIVGKFFHMKIELNFLSAEMSHVRHIILPILLFLSKICAFTVFVLR